MGGGFCGQRLKFWLFYGKRQYHSIVVTISYFAANFFYDYQLKFVNFYA